MNNKIKPMLLLFLLFISYSAELKAQTPLVCDEVPGGGLTPAALGVLPYLLGQGGFIDFDLFARGTDNRIYTNRHVSYSGEYSGWNEVPGDGRTISQPSAVFVNGVVKLFVRGLGNGIHENDFNGTTWSGWSEVPGAGLTLSGPFAVVHGGIVKVFVRGLGNGIHENDFNGATWSGWSEVPGNGRTIAEPTAVVHAGMLKLFVRGTSNGIHENDFNGTWSGWAEVPGGGLTLAGPSVLIDNFVPKLFATGLDNAVWKNDFTGSNWSGWSRISEGALTALAPAAGEVFPLGFSPSPQVFLTSEDGRILSCYGF